MLVYVNFKAVEITCDLSAHFTVDLEPGVWELVHNKTTYSVTTLSGTLRAGELVFTYPRGVERRPSGVWGARPRIIAATPGWNDIPAPVQEAITDAYLLQRHDLPQSPGGPQ